MTYLTPSLPRDDTTRRYALVGKENDDPGRWLALGVQPIIFPQAERNDYSGLDNAVAGLAHCTRRRILDWQREIANIASAPPPIDEESAGIIEYALTEPVYTRFFVEQAVSPDWIEWLDRRNHFAALFSNGNLSDQDRMLASWLARCFALAHDDALFRTIESHGSRLNSEFWKQLSWQMQHSVSQSPDSATMTRWVIFLASATPDNADDIALLWIGEASASVGAMDALLKAYESMTALINREPYRLGGSSSDRYHHELETMLTDCISSNLPQIAEPVLEITTRRLSERHSALAAWKLANSKGDSDSYTRSAIEPHPQNQSQYDIDALIDVARECLDWLAANRPDMVKMWSERYVRSQVPLLRRLAIHILPARTDLSASDKIACLLEHCDVSETAARHELFRAVSSAYPHASMERREDFIAAVSAFRWPNEDEPEKQRLEAGHRYRWFHWLQQADPQCDIAKQAVNAMLARHPEFRPLDYPDFDFYFYASGTVAGRPSPWNVQEMLGQPPAEWLLKALGQQPSEHDYDPRDQLIDNVEEATKQQPSWGLELAAQMESAKAWSTHLWRGVIKGLQSVELDEADLAKAVKFLSVTNLHDDHRHEITDALGNLIGKNQSVTNPAILLLANDTARELWQQVPSDDRMPNSDWLMKAINHQAGNLAEFWMQSIAAWWTHQEPKPTELSNEYHEALSEMIANPELPGALAKVVLTRRFPLLAQTDESWTQQNLLPLLVPEHRDFSPAWGGLTRSGAMSPRSAQLLRDPFLNAVEHISLTATSELRNRFIRMYTGMLTWFVAGPTDDWITKLLNNSDEEIRQLFATQIGFYLRSLDEEAQREWWSIWLEGYWQNRLQNVPVPLDPGEIEAMTEWTSWLPAIYPEAVELAVQMPTVQLRRSSTLYELKRSDIPDRHPESVANLLIHLSKENSSSFMLHRAKEIIDRLLQSGLGEETETGLKEVAAQVGL